MVPKARFFSFLLVLAWGTVRSFRIATTTATGTFKASLFRAGYRPSLSPCSMCICINCARVTNCAAYHFVETKHAQPHMNENPTFSPREGSPTIHVNIRTNRDHTVVPRIWKEHEEETRRAEEMSTSAKDGTELHGSTVYDLSPVTTVEYDVVACADYVEDKGCWVRNMPNEIRKANPHFVPT